MILTVTLNPAIDRTIEVEELAVDMVNRVKSVRRDMGGKGLNVSKTIKAMGGESTALLLLGGENGLYIQNEARKMGITLEVIEVNGNTRENIKIVDPVHKTYTDLNESGPTADATIEDKIKSYIERTLKPSDWLVLSGSSLPGMSDNLFADLIMLANSVGAKTLVDVDGDHLKKVIAHRPYLIKPNLHELEQCFGTPLTSRKSVIEHARLLLERGAEVAVVSMGGEGLLWITLKEAWFAPALKVHVKSTVGAGDALVAGIAMGLSQGLTMTETIKKAVAAATCVIITEGSRTGNMSEMNEFESKINLIEA